MKKRRANRIPGWQPPPTHATYCARRDTCLVGTCVYKIACDHQTILPPPN